MFRELLKRQLVEDILSFRFLLNFILIIATVIVFALIFIVHFRDMQINYSNAIKENEQRLTQFARNPQSGEAFANLELRMKPRAEEFISFGDEDKMPRGLYFRMFPYELRLLNPREDIAGRGWYFPVSRRASINTSAFFSPDVTSVILFLLSFFAIALTFNAVTGEKEEGTLRLVLSNSTKRVHVLISKYISALLTLGLPLLFSILGGLFILGLSGMSVFPLDFIIELLAFFLISLLYLSTFILIGLCCSALCQSSRKSLVLGLLFWVFFVFVFPKSMGLFLNLKRFEVPSPAQIEKLADDLGKEVGDNYAKRINLSLIKDEERRTEVIFEKMGEEQEAKQKLRDLYLKKKIASVLSLRNIAAASPAALFENASSALAGTGIYHFEHLWNQAKLFSYDYVSFVKERAGKRQNPSPFFFDLYSLTNKPVDPSLLPRFDEKNVRFGVGLGHALPYIAILILYNLFLFAFILHKFQNYDVR